MYDKKCGCVILNYNDYETTMKLVDEIRDYNELDYIIIVDNLSTDDSYAKLSEIADSKIKVINSNKNGGYGYGNNLGVKYAFYKLGCELILISNPDVLFTEKTVNKMKECINSNSDIGAVAPMQCDCNGNLIRDVAWCIPTISQYIVSAEYLIGKYTKQFHYSTEFIKNSNNDKVEVECVPGSLLMVRAEAFLEVGGYDSDMFLFCEGTTLAKKFKEQRWKTILLKNEQYIHYHSISLKRTIKSVTKQRKILLKSRYIFIKKYLCANKWQLFFAKIWYLLTIWEYAIIQAIKKCM